MKIHIVGVPMDLGTGRRGVDMGPSSIRIACVTDKLLQLGHTVLDEGDIPIKIPEKQKIKNDRLKYLPEIVRVCTILSSKVDRVMQPTCGGPAYAGVSKLIRFSILEISQQNSQSSLSSQFLARQLSNDANDILSQRNSI